MAPQPFLRPACIYCIRLQAERDSALAENAELRAEIQRDRAELAELRETRAAAYTAMRIEGDQLRAARANARSAPA